MTFDQAIEEALECISDSDALDLVIDIINTLKDTYENGELEK